MGKTKNPSDDPKRDAREWMYKKLIKELEDCD